MEKEMTLGIVGLGQMGSGIAQVLSYQYKVKAFDFNELSLQRGMQNIHAGLEKATKKGWIDVETSRDATDRLEYCNSIEALSDCSLVIEAITENVDAKSHLFATLDALLDEKAIIATNTSSIPISTLAQSTKRAEKVIGIHFMNPVPIMKLVEGIKGDKTSEETISFVSNLISTINKELIWSKDSPGFVVNRILMPMINEAIITLEEGVASCEDIDKGMQLGCHQPMGPLRLADFIGLDTCLAILNVMYEGLKNDKYKPAKLLEKLVAEKKLGKKAKLGFYSY